MNTEKRKRGRPPGTGKDDMPLLREIAGLMVAEPGLKVATAHKRLRRKPDAPSLADLRRIQIKFREHGPTLMSQARTRPQSRATVRSASLGLFGALGDLEHVARVQRQVEETLGASYAFYRSVRELMDSPIVRAQRELDAQMKMLGFGIESPLDRLQRQMLDDPYERMLRSAGLR